MVCQHSAMQNMGGACESCTDKTVQVIAQGEGIGFWQIGDEVYRADPHADLDTYGLPMGRRWECSLTHWRRFRAVYGWVRDVA